MTARPHTGYEKKSSSHLGYRKKEKGGGWEDTRSITQLAWSQYRGTRFIHAMGAAPKKEKKKTPKNPLKEIGKRKEGLHRQRYIGE